MGERTGALAKGPTGLFRSECGLYICRYVGCGGYFEAWLADGSKHWTNTDRLDGYPPAFGVGGYSAEITGQKKGSFTLNLLDCDPTIKIIPFRGNTIIESRDVVFRRKIPWMHAPRWLRALAQVEREIAADGEAE